MSVTDIDSRRPHTNKRIQCECGHTWEAVYQTKPPVYLECPGCGKFVNEYGTYVLVGKCNKQEDPYRKLAAKIFGIREEAVTPEMRRHAKAAALMHLYRYRQSKGG